MSRTLLGNAHTTEVRNDRHDIAAAESLILRGCDAPRLDSASIVNRKMP